MLDHQRCKYILAVARCQSISKAAEQLYISQPSLSRFVKQVESDLGTALFNREKLPLTLTEAGTRFLAYAAEFEQLEARLREEFLQMGRHRRLTIAALPFLGTYALPKVVPRFAEQFPTVQLDIQEATSRRLLETLDNGEADLCLTNLEPKSRELASVYLCADPVALVGLRTPRWESRFDLRQNSIYTPLEVDLHSLEDETLIVLRPWQNMRVIAEQICRRFLFAPHRVVEAPSLATAMSLVSSNRGLTFINVSSLRCIAPQTPLVYFSVGDMGDTAAIRAVHRVDSANPLIGDFCSCAARTLRERLPQTQMPV